MADSMLSRHRKVRDRCGAADRPRKHGTLQEARQGKPVLEELDINGDPPALAGLTCQELLVQQYWYSGRLEDEANVIFLKFGQRWYRLYFDSGIIFWRPQDSPPESVPPTD